MEHDHDDGGHDHDIDSGSDSTRTLAAVAGINVLGFCAEFAGGLLFGSVALLSDALHMLFDALAYVMAFVASAVADRYTGSAEWSYGLHRLEPLSAFLNGALLIPMVIYIVYESYQQRTDCKNDDLDLPSPGDLLLEQWLGVIDDINGRVKHLDREIERMAKAVPETELLMTVPGISSYSGLMIHAEIGEIARFDEAGQVVSYAGLDPSVRESGDTRHEGSISKEGSSYLRWILVQCAQTAVHTCKDPYLSDFYWRLRERKGKPAKVALVATARKLLVSIFHMLTNEEVYDPPGVTG